MSKIIASAGINGAYTIVGRARKKYDEALEKYGSDREVAFPNTGYFLPIIYGILGIAVKKLSDMGPVLDRAASLLPPRVKETHNLPYLGPALDAGMATFFAEECEQAVRYLDEPNFYLAGREEVADDNIWLGAADDVIMRKRGVEFVDGTAPGFAAVLGRAPSAEIAAKIAQELQEKNLYVFMSSGLDGKPGFAEQLVEAGVQIGWNTRLVPFGPDTSSVVFSIGFATRAAMSFGNIKPGDFRKILIYNKDRIFAFVLPFGYVDEEWYANALGAVNFGFPVIADTPIPQILPTGVCTYEHVVSGVPYDQLVPKAVEVRGLKVKVTSVPIPVSYSPAYEGERVRKDDLVAECGGGRTMAVELTTTREMDEVTDGTIEVIGPDLDIYSTARAQGGPAGESPALPLAIVVEVAGRQMQKDFEPILERQLHHLINYAQGVMHIGQRNIVWLRFSKQAVEKGFRLGHLGSIIHAKYHEDFGNIFDKVQIKIYTDEARVKEIHDRAVAIFRERDERIEGMVDETTDPFYSCTLCQSFAPNHVCIVTPERPGLCGAYSWLDCRASFEINPTGPNQPVVKGRTIDELYGQWEGVNEFVSKASRGNVTEYDAYSLMRTPMTSCGCFECIACIMPLSNGVMTVDRDFPEMTPAGMKFTTMAGMVGGGNVTPGFVGHSKYYITSRKFLRADGGIKRLVWMPSRLKEEIMDRLIVRAKEEGVPDLPDKIADERIGTTEEEILPFLEKVKHPALGLPPLF
jgi:acetyl-CoA synthase